MLYIDFFLKLFFTLKVNSLMLYDSDSKESSAEQKKLLEVKRTPSNFKNSILTVSICI